MILTALQETEIELEATKRTLADFQKEVADDLAQKVADALAADKVANLKAAMRSASKDMHRPSMRPCPTCQRMTEALGEPWGCYDFQATTKNPCEQ